MKHSRIALLCSLVVLLAAGAFAADWPMWRYDANRSAASPCDLPDELHLQWVRQYTPRVAVWDDPLNQDLMPYDNVFEPVVVGTTMFVAFNDSDKVVAIDTESGEEKWKFYTDGPVRLPPVTWQGNVYFASDDGHLYCLNAKSGKLVWKLRGGPSGWRILGNKRLISTWPVRGGPVIKDGVVYFAASIWPFMGTFIYALDAETGRIIWLNDSDSATYQQQPHGGALSFGGVAPQGAFVVAGDTLLVPGGRSVPAVLDRHSGKLLYYQFGSSGKTGGSFVCATEEVFFNHHREKVTTMYDLKTGRAVIRRIGKHPVLTETAFYLSGKPVVAVDFEGPLTIARKYVAEVEKAYAEWSKSDKEWKEDLEKWKDNEEKYKESEAKYEKAESKLRAALAKSARPVAKWKDHMLWKIDVDASGDLIKVGKRLYAAGDGRITAVDVPEEGKKPRIAWTKRVEGQVERLVAADNKLFAVTLDGRIMAFGAKKTTPRQILVRPVATEPSARMTEQAFAILEQTGVREGYALFYGGDGDLLEALVSNSDLHVVAVDPDATHVETLRRRFDATGLYGKRIAILRGDPFTLQAPPYMASLTIVDGLDEAKYPRDKAFLEQIYNSMRPYGGVAWLRGDGERGKSKLSHMVQAASLPGLKVEVGANACVISREGALPGAAYWTHQYGDIANTAKSDDKLVKLPLGLLWFGGSSNLDVLPRHAHGPPEQIVGGRLFIEGINSMSARDVYTGRVIWKTMLHDLGMYGVYYNETYKDTPTSTRYNQGHIPGANIRGTNFVATMDRVYVIQGRHCHVLDAATGERVEVISLPPVDPNARRPKSPPWGYIGVYKDLLIGGYGFAAFSDLLLQKKRERSVWTDFDKSASQSLIIMDRYTGEILWRVDADLGFLHNAIAVGNDTIFCLDKLPPHTENQLKRRGRTPPDTYRLMAIDVRTGEVLWEKKEKSGKWRARGRKNTIFGSFLSYSDEHDILLQATRPSSDTVRGEQGVRMIAYRGADGMPLWDKKMAKEGEVLYQTFPILHGDRIITEGNVFSLFTGEPVRRTNPLTGEQVPWSWQRMYGCNYPIAGEHILTFRSGAAGFYDFANDGGTGNFGGFKSGCTSNLVAADGVLNAPDYTRTCSCSYQNQTSLALVHMPEVEIWTFNTHETGSWCIKHVGINLGAPGDRVAGDGTLWLDYPSVGGSSPDIPVRVTPEEPDWFLHHSSRVKGEGLKWVAASGGKGITSITLTLAGDAQEERTYTVRLHFAEDEDLKPGERVFDVAIQGKLVLQGLDVVKEAGGPLRPVAREFKGVKVKNDLTIALTNTDTAKAASPIMSGIEVVAEGW